MCVKQLLLLSFLSLVSPMAGATASSAQERPRSMLGAHDLKSAILSPVPLGPPSQFEHAADAAKPVTMAPRKIASNKPRQKTAVVARKPKSNPLDSYARDTRPQVWPCVGGGICAWMQPR